MIYTRELSPTVIHTWIQLRGLAWGRDETPRLSMLELSDLTGKSRSTIFGHMALLRKWGALRWRSSEVSTLIVTFPADTGEFFLDGDSLPSPGESGILDDQSNFPESENLEKLYPSLPSPINQLDINAVEEREREDNQLDLSRGSTIQEVGLQTENLDAVQKSVRQSRESFSPRDVREGIDEFQNFGLQSKNSEFVQESGLSPDLDSADPIKVYRSLTGIRPNKPQREQLKSLIQDNNIWYASVAHWQSHGWNPKNIAGILELYQRGGPTACRYCSQENDPEDKSLSALNQLREEIKEPANGSS